MCTAPPRGFGGDVERRRRTEPARDPNQFMKLIQAAGAGDENEVKRLLKSEIVGLDDCIFMMALDRWRGQIDMADHPDAVNPLSAACKHGHVG